jgi:hypothetical protein
VVTFSNLVFLLFIVLIISIILTGGFEIRWWGQKISCRHLQNPVRVLIILIAFKLVRCLVKKKEELTAAFPGKYLSKLLWIGIPISLWFFLPGTIDSFLGFAVNRSSALGMFSRENLCFYPEAILREYCLTGGIFIFLAVFYLFSLLSLKKASPEIKFLHIYFLVGLGLMMVHPYKEARFIFIILPALWVISVSKAMGFMIDSKMKRFIVPIFICGVIAYSPRFYSSAKGLYENKLIPNIMHWFQPTPDLAPVINYIVSEIGTPGNVAIQGTFNELSPDLIKWNIFNAGTGKNKEILFDLRKEEVLEKLKRYGVKKLISIKVNPASPFYSLDYVNYNLWKMDTIQSIEDERMFAVKQVKYFNSVGVEVSVEAGKPIVR